MEKAERAAAAADAVDLSLINLLFRQFEALGEPDVCAAIGWVAEQRWCSGSVGMIGISWGGFAALQVAAIRIVDHWASFLSNVPGRSKTASFPRNAQ